MSRTVTRIVAAIAPCGMRALRPALGAGTAALLLASCAVGPNFVPPAVPDVDRYTPEQLSSPSMNAGGPSVPKQHFVNGEDVSLRWWTAFRSKPLDELIKMSVEHNPSLQSAEAAIRIAQYNALAQRGLFFPQIGANYTPSQQQISGASGSGPGGQSPSVFSLHTAQLNVSFVPDIWGQNVRAVESLDAISEQQLFQLEAAYLTLTANVVTAAIQEASLRGQIAAIQRVVKIERGILEIVKNQFNAGGAAQVDVLAQEAALAQSEQLLPPLEKQLAVQRDLLTSLAGQFSADEILQKFTLDRLALPANLPVSLPSKMIRQRPDVRAAEALLHSANAQIGVAIAARLPNITITGNTGAAAFTLAELFTPGTSFYAIAASATQPIFDGLTLYHKQKAAEAAVDQADALYRQAVVTAMQNVADALRSLQADARALQAAVKAELAAKASLDIIQKQLALGQVSQVVVLNAQQVYLTAAVVRVQAQATRLSDSAALFMALGGAWPANCASDDWRKCVLDDAPAPTAQRVSENGPPAR
ncbi:efflux transporter outer membrane subunit [Bradyrhizobium sp. UFLA03-84]|uniref:efflux transporter outer membrane subunit n=1 Tax=Bradyrhizobium sp. UFLA03-84 TaxID=418599 RepID=UPI0026C57FDC